MAVPGVTPCNCWSIRNQEAIPPCPFLGLRVCLLRKIPMSSFGPYAVLKSWPSVRGGNKKSQCFPTMGLWPELVSPHETDCYLSHLASESYPETRPQMLLWMRKENKDCCCDDMCQIPHPTLSMILTSGSQQLAELSIHIPILQGKKSNFKEMKEHTKSLWSSDSKRSLTLQKGTKSPQSLTSQRDSQGSSGKMS